MTEAPKPIGFTEPADIPMQVDLRALRGEHLTVIANSGAGKSGLIRKLLEVTHGEIQQIVLDPEDEYYTLREGGDYIIAGGEDGDCPATVENAPALAAMLMESGISAVIQMNHLKNDAPQEFVAAFLEALMETPRRLWHPVILVIDEAHRFIPQDGTTAATEAVRDFFARGRKRGFTGVLATQRMASIEKMVTGNINNWALGRVGQATDRKVVLNMLGFTATSSEGKTLMALEDRTFWMFGRGVGAKLPVLMRVADAETTIVESGEAKIPTKPAPARLKELLEGLKKVAPATMVADTPEKAAQGPSQGQIEASRQAGYSAGHSAGRSEGYDAGMQDGMRFALHKVEAAAQDIRNCMDEPFGAPAPRQVEIAAEPLKKGDEIAVPVPLKADSPIHKVTPDVPAKMSRRTQDILAFLEAIHPRAVPFNTAAKQAGVGMSSSQFRTYEPELKTSGRVEQLPDGRYRALVSVGSRDDYWAKVEGQLPPKYLAILRFIRRAGQPVTRDEIVVGADVSPTSSTTSAALSLLINEADVVEMVGDRYQIVEVFR